MSDPVSNAEIEDVLSSIRRLVSEDPSPMQRRKRNGEDAKERFVLTPALRVPADAEANDGDTQSPEEAPESAETSVQHDNSDNSDTAAPDQADSGQPDAAEQAEPAASELSEKKERFDASRQTLEQRIAELETALQHSPEEWEPDGSEVAASEASGMPSFSDSPESPEAVTTRIIDQPTDDSDISAFSEKSEFLQDHSEVAEAEPEPSIEARNDPGPRPPLPVDQNEGSGTAGVPKDDTERRRSVKPDQVSEAEIVDEPVAPTIRSDAGATSEVDAIENASWQSDPEKKQEAGQVPEQPNSAKPEPEPELSVDPSPQAEPAMEQAEAQQTPDADDEGDAERFELFEEPAVMDEDALRDLVSQLVRVELQGVLGERITRNVRRLVRREIQRAMAMRDLE